jgi:hypothetical protein
VTGAGAQDWKIDPLTPTTHLVQAADSYGDGRFDLVPVHARQGAPLDASEPHSADTQRAAGRRHV